MITQRVVAIAALGIALAAPARAQDAYDGEWHYSPSIHGSLRFELPSRQASADATVNPHSYLSDLKFALMLTGEARKSNFAVVIDQRDDKPLQNLRLSGPAFAAAFHG